MRSTSIVLLALFCAVEFNSFAQERANYFNTDGLYSLVTL